jgi:hypothetical protein
MKCKDCHEEVPVLLKVGDTRWCLRCATEREILTRDEARAILEQHKAKQRVVANGWNTQMLYV